MGKKKEIHFIFHILHYLLIMYISRKGESCVCELSRGHDDYGPRVKDSKLVGWMGIV